MESVWHSAARLTSPGGERTTWVISARSSPRDTSENDITIEVGVDSTLQTRPSRALTRFSTSSRRGAAVPYSCSRRDSSTTKPMRVFSATSLPMTLRVASASIRP
jgi:hypothetical protein